MSDRTGDLALDLAGATVLVTGANTGIGRVTAVTLARRGARVWLAGRSRARTEPVLDEIRSVTRRPDAAAFLELDLSDLDQVRSAAATFLATGEPLSILSNNAGLAGKRGTTKQGFELAFGTNHLGPFLFTQLLWDRVADPKSARAGEPGRIVNVSSAAHRRVTSIDWSALRETTRSPTGYPEYCVSKLCNVLFTKELTKRWRADGQRDVHAYALHPGVIASDVWREVPWPIRSLVKLFMKGVVEGAATTLYCATSSDVTEHDGRYYQDSAERRPSAAASDPALARTLWEKSEDWTRDGAH